MKTIKKPVHKNCCGHPRNSFVEHIFGCDIHKYKSIFGDATYCIRYGDEDHEYCSSILTLEGAHAMAALKSSELLMERLK